MVCIQPMKYNLIGIAIQPANGLHKYGGMELFRNQLWAIVKQRVFSQK